MDRYFLTYTLDYDQLHIMNMRKYLIQHRFIETRKRHTEVCPTIAELPFLVTAKVYGVPCVISEVVTRELFTTTY